MGISYKRNGSYPFHPLYKIYKISIAFLFIVAFLFFYISQGVAEQNKKEIIISTTTSVDASGLLSILLPVFSKDTGINVKYMAKGTGAALKDGIEGNVDAVLVHDPRREKIFVAKGYGTKRYPFMHSDFVLLGPEKDPAGASNAGRATDAFKRIAASKSTFISRGDESGTHAKEKAIWIAAGIDPSMILHEKWYLSVGQGMGKTLIIADEKKAYTLCDRGTFLKFRYMRKPPVELTIIFEKDPMLNNPYALIPVNPARFPHVNHEAALEFAKWLQSEKAQRLIAEYQIAGQQLFVPDNLPNSK